MSYAGHDERRDRILAAAAGLLAESGIERLSVRRVAEAAGIGMGTLRHYFPSQKELHQALIVRLVDGETHEFDIRDARLPAADRLERCLLQYVPTDGESAHLLDLWFGLYRVGLDPAGPPFARQFLEVSAARSRERMQEWLELLASEGYLEPHSVRRHVLRCSALVSGVCLELVTPGSEMTVEDARRIVSDAVRAIVRKDPARGR